MSGSLRETQQNNSDSEREKVSGASQEEGCCDPIRLTCDLDMRGLIDRKMRERDGLRRA